jgi:hypothetical protein
VSGEDIVLTSRVDSLGILDELVAVAGIRRSVPARTFAGRHEPPPALAWLLGLRMGPQTCGEWGGP